MKNKIITLIISVTIFTVNVARAMEDEEYLKETSCPSPEKKAVKFDTQSSSPVEERKELTMERNSPQRARAASVSISLFRERKDSSESLECQPTPTQETVRSQIISSDGRIKSKEKTISPERNRRRSSSSSNETKALRSESQSSSPIEEQREFLIERNFPQRERAATTSPLRQRKDSRESPERQSPLSQEISKSRISSSEGQIKSEYISISPEPRQRRRSSSSSHEKQTLISASQSSTPLEEEIELILGQLILGQNSPQRERAATTSPLRQRKNSRESPERQPTLPQKVSKSRISSSEGQIKSEYISISPEPRQRRRSSSSSHEKQILIFRRQSSSPTEEREEHLMERNSPQRARAASISTSPLKQRKDSRESPERQSPLSQEISKSRISSSEGQIKSDYKAISPEPRQRRSSSSSHEEQKNSPTEKRSLRRSGDCPIQHSIGSLENQTTLVTELNENSPRTVKIWGKSSDCKGINNNSSIYFKYFLYNSLIHEDFDVCMAVNPVETYVYNRSLRIGQNVSQEGYEKSKMSLETYITRCKEYDDLFCSERSENTFVVSCLYTAKPRLIGYSSTLLLPSYQYDNEIPIQSDNPLFNHLEQKK